MDQNEIKETREFVSTMFAFVAQGVKSFSDGLQVVPDAVSFADEVTELPRAINGLGESWNRECIAIAKNPALADGLYLEQREKLASSGLPVGLCATIETQVKAIHFTLCEVARSKSEKA